MAFQRLKLKPEAELLDHEGNVVGKLRSITIDLYGEEPSAPSKGKGQAVVVGEQQALLGEPEAHGSRETHDPAKAVWDHYVQTMKPRASELNPDARRLIIEALKVATEAELKRAIDGCSSSEFHMGKNDGLQGKGKKYNALSQIIKGRRGRETTRERIDFFLELADKSGLPSGVTSADAAKVAQAKRDVLAAEDFPDAPHVQEKGATAKAWLESLGFRIGRNPETGRPTFQGPGT